MVSGKSRSRPKPRNTLALVVWISVCTLLLGATCPPPPPKINYVYDVNGRLVAVIDTTAADPNTAVYNYDGAGNITSIERRASTAVSIISFSPGCGAVGSTLTIDGIAFSTTASSNTVTFANGATATPSTATANRLVVTVPASAGSGTLRVTAAGVQSPVSTRSFTVGCSAPTITSFSPNGGVANTAVTVNGTNFQTTAADNRVTFNGMLATVGSATSTQIGTTVPTNIGSGRISVTTPFGTASSPSDFIIPPPPYAVSDLLADRVAIGQTKTEAFNPPIQAALVLFDGTAGHRLSVQTSFNNGFWTITVLKPNGTTLTSGYNIGGVFLEPTLLPVSGTYSILCDPNDLNTGSITLTPYDVVDLTGTIVVDGAAVSQTITAPGQVSRLTFTGATTQRISATVSFNGASGFWTVALLKPDGSQLANAYDFVLNGLFIEPQAVPSNGTYTVLLDPDSTGTGPFTVNLYNVQDITGTIAIPGQATANITKPGQNALYTFNGTANQQVSVTGSFPFHAWWLSIRKPDGTTLTSSYNVNGNSVGPVTLPVTGQYTVVADPDRTSTGQITLNTTSP